MQGLCPQRARVGPTLSGVGPRPLFPARFSLFAMESEGRASSRDHGGARVRPVGLPSKRAHEPSWHRRMRAKRSQARILVKLGEACAALARHHGSSVPIGLKHVVESLGQGFPWSSHGAGQVQGFLTSFSAAGCAPTLELFAQDLTQAKAACVQTQSVCEDIK